MKKFAILLIALVLVQSNVMARDYAKLQVKEMKHAQKYNTTEKYVPAAHATQVLPTVNVSKIKDPKIMKFGNYEKVDNSKYNAKTTK